MIAAGTLLPIMDIIFGKFINAFNDFVNGKLSPAGYRSEVGKYRYALAFLTLIFNDLRENQLLSSLYFVYLFVAKFVLTYLWTVSRPSLLLLCRMFNVV